MAQKQTKRDRKTKRTGLFRKDQGQLYCNTNFTQCGSRLGKRSIVILLPLFVNTLKFRYWYHCSILFYVEPFKQWLFVLFSWSVYEWFTFVEYQSREYNFTLVRKLTCFWFIVSCVLECLWVLHERVCSNIEDKSQKEIPRLGSVENMWDLK